MVKNKKKDKRTQKQIVADLEKNMLGFKSEMIDLAKDLVQAAVKIKEGMVGLQGAVDTLIAGVGKATNNMAKSIGDELLTLGKEIQKIEEGFGRVQGVIDEKMFFAERDTKKLTEPKKTVKPGPGQLPVEIKKSTPKNIPYTRNAKQFRELQGMEPDIYNIIVAGRFGEEIRVKPYDDETGKNYVSNEQFKWLAQALAAKGFGRKAGKDGYFSNKIKPQVYNNRPRYR